MKKHVSLTGGGVWEKWSWNIRSRKMVKVVIEVKRVIARIIFVETLLME